MSSLSAWKETQLQEVYAAWVAASTALHFPNHHVYAQACRDLGTHVRGCLHYGSIVLYLTLQPVLYACGYVVRALVRFFYRHGLAQLQLWTQKCYEFHKSLSGKQLLVELLTILSLTGLYRLRRSQWWRNVQVRIDYRRQQAVKSYRKSVHQLAQASRLAALMIPHTLFMALVVTTGAVLPEVWVFVAESTPLLLLLSLAWPLLATTVIVYDQRQSEKEAVLKKDTKTKSKIKRPPLRTLSNAPAARRQRRSSLGGLLLQQHIDQRAMEEEIDYWKRIWMLYGCIAFIKQVMSRLPLPTLASATTVASLELVLYLWIYMVPHITPSQLDTKESRPLYLITHHALEPYLEAAVDAISGVISADFWQNKVVEMSRTFLKALSFVKLLSESTVDRLVLTLVETRPLVVPLATLLTPWFVAQYGAAYVQFLVPAYQQNLCYWVLHVVVYQLLTAENVLAYVPFVGTHLRLLLAAYLCLPHTIQDWYPRLEHELQVFEILPPEGDTAMESHLAPWLARCFHWVVDKLPKGTDDIKEEKEEAKDDTLDPNVAASDALDANAALDTTTEIAH